MFHSIKIVSPQVFLIVRQAWPKSTKLPTSLWAILSGIKLGRIIKTIAVYHSPSINHQNRVGGFPYSHWLICNFSVKFDDQKFSDTYYDEGHCGRSILKNLNPSHVFYVQCLGSLRVKFAGNPSIFHTLKICLKKVHSRENEVAFLRLKFCKHFTPLLRHLSTLWCRQPIKILG